MIRIAVVEDDDVCVEMIHGYIERYSRESGEPMEVTVFHSGLELVEGYRPVYDVILMDIEMPHLDGMSAAERIRRQDSAVLLIFITNMAQYAIRGYQVDALDYVLKPVSYYAFAIKLQKAVRILRERMEKQILLTRDKETIRVSISDIYYIEVADHQLQYHTANGAFTATGSLREVEKALEGQHFVRCNSCYLVNLRHVSGIKHDMAGVAGHALKISRPKKRQFLDALSSYYGGGGR